MHAEQQHRTPSTRDQFNGAVNVILLGCAALSFSVEAFLRSGFGRRYMGLQAALVFPVVLLFSLGWPHHNLLPLMGFLLAYVAVCAGHRLRTLTRKFKREPGHTGYSGRPRLGRFVPWMNEVTLKRLVEPAVVGLAGVLLIGLNEPLGAYLCIAAIALFIRVNVNLLEQQSRELDMQDAIFERRQEVESLRHS